MFKKLQWGKLNCLYFLLQNFYCIKNIIHEIDFETRPSKKHEIFREKINFTPKKKYINWKVNEICYISRKKGMNFLKCLFFHSIIFFSFKKFIAQSNVMFKFAMHNFTFIFLIFLEKEIQGVLPSLLL
jgi:hypothetical protein